MMPGTDSDGATPGVLVLTRTLRLRRPVVWRLWTDPSHLAAWWGPHGFTNPECSIDPRPGGAIRILMRSADGREYLNEGQVQLVDEPRLLVFEIALLTADGAACLRNLTTVELEEHAAGTRLTVRVQVLHATAEAREHLAGMRDGWSESLDRLAGRLGIQEANR